MNTVSRLVTLLYDEELQRKQFRVHCSGERRGRRRPHQMLHCMKVASSPSSSASLTPASTAISPMTTLPPELTTCRAIAAPMPAHRQGDCELYTLQWTRAQPDQCTSVGIVRTCAIETGSPSDGWRRNTPPDPPVTQTTLSCRTPACVATACISIVMTADALAEAFPNG